MKLSNESLNADYRNKLLTHASVLIRLECGVEVPMDELMLAIAFLQGHLQLLLNMSIEEAPF